MHFGEWISISTEDSLTKQTKGLSLSTSAFQFAAAGRMIDFRQAESDPLLPITVRCLEENIDDEARDHVCIGWIPIFFMCVAGLTIRVNDFAKKAWRRVSEEGSWL